MPLPAANTPWPPPAFAPALATMTEHAAWYAGDPARLEKVYRSKVAAAPENRPSQYRGGVVGAVSRFWWGRPSPTGQAPRRLHVPIAADIASTSSDVLFGSPPQIRLVGAPEQAQTRLDETFAALDALLCEAGEVAAALRGVYLRAGWDLDLRDRPIVDVVQPDTVVPTFRRGYLVAADVVAELARDGVTVWRHVEHHEPGVILHGLYRGTGDNLGAPVPLDARPETAGYDPAVPVPGGRLAIVYVPNMRPDRANRGDPLGRSDLAGAEPLMDALDEAYTSWARDIRLGKARLVVPADYVTNLGPGQGAAFDAEREIYDGLNIPPTSTQAGITVAQFAIRVEEHRETARAWIERIIATAGYSAGSFGLDDPGSGGAMTATEVTQRLARSMTTRRRKMAYWRPALVDLARVVLAIDAEVFRAPTVGEGVDVEWPPAVSPGALELAQTAQALRAAEAASDEVIVRTVHPDWDDDQVVAEVVAIGTEREAAMPDVPDPGAGMPA